MPVELELADPEDLWAESCALAMLSVGTPSWGATVRGDGVRTDDVGNGWHGMSWVEGGRAILYGYDVDYSETRHQVPPVDLLAGGPAWLPWEWLARMMRDEHIVQYVYWWDGSTWARTDYPDGLKDGGGGETGRNDQVESSFFAWDDDGGERAEEAFEALIGAARARAVDREAVDGLLRHLDPDAFDIEPTEPFDAEAMLGVAEQAGVRAGSVRPELPAGRGEPADRRVHVIDDPRPWEPFEEGFMTDGIPARLCWSPSLGK
ncbi:hypothetical protein [Actinomadura violacea]|uniref:Uncharacterized protein n=1 Tax=Actinomadura violacea TaxID=2819934 RepID=A0ABS3S629_9ACTN|nr:hypothetical protein [Actinomadura violacea]MBO2464208.1 hypothetical protein [Actinomadura violacea]